MNAIIADRLVDRSGPEEFLFFVRCMACGQEQLCKRLPFSKAGITPENEHKRAIYKTLYQREHGYARSKALPRAKELLNLCPICLRLVCDNCFLICEDLDMCSACAHRLQETGTPVQDEP